MSFSKKHILNGTITEVDTSVNKTQEKLRDFGKAEEKYLDPGSIPLEDALVLGSEKAEMKVIVFTDPD